MKYANNFQPRPKDPIHPDFPGTVPDLWVRPDVPPNSVRGANASGFVKSLKNISDNAYEHSDIPVVEAGQPSTSHEKKRMGQGDKYV